jgi:putative ABC transport system permease protein
MRPHRDDEGARRRAEGVYELLLRLYPADFRAEFGQEMVQLFRARHAEARYHAAPWGAARFWRDILVDLAATAPAQRLASVASGLRARRDRLRTDAGAHHHSRGSMETLAQDTRYALRTLRARPAFTVVAVLTLALGIGANATIFSVVNELLLRPLPFHEPERLVTVWGVREGKRGGVSYPDLLDFSRESRAFSGIALLAGQTVNFTGGDTPDRLRGAFVTGSVFDVIGVKAAVGRTFTDAESEMGRAVPVAVLSHELWKTRFGGDPTLIGRALQLNGRPFEVIGILPAGFRSPFDDPDVWIPGPFHTSKGAFDRANHFVPALGRLKPGATLTEARAELAIVADRLAREYPESNAGWGADVEPLQRTLTGDVRAALLTLFAVVGVVLLIACANVANLLLARAAARRREMSLRAALGAGRGRLVRQLLTESVVLSAAGGALGLLLAHAGLKGLLAVVPSSFILFRHVGVDGDVLLFSLVLAVGCGVLFGLAPALHASRANLNEAFVARGASAFAASGRFTARNVFVVAQVALSIVLLVAAGLLTRSLIGLQRLDPGFDPRGVLTMEFRLPATKYTEDAQAAAFMERAIAEIRRVPGVRSAALARAVPFSYNGATAGYVVEGREPAPGVEPPESQLNTVTPEYFATLGIPLRAGRDFAGADRADAPPVVVVNEALARREWPDQSALGRRLRAADGGPWLTVVGVVGNAKHYGLGDAPVAQAYLPYAQTPGIFASVVARTAGDPLALAPAVRAAIWSVDRDQPVWKIRTLETMIRDTLGQQRFTMGLVAGFAAVALLLAGIGIYGVMSYAVAQRTQEVGVRLALGAQRGEVLRLVVRQGLALTGVAVAVGLVGALAAARVLASQLHGVSTADPLTFAAVPMVLGAVALVATYLPARRASRLDPMVALRYE